MQTIYISTSPSYTTKMGDVDYAMNLVSELTNQGVNAIFYSSDKSGKQHIDSMLEQSKKDGTKPVLHLMLNVNRTALGTGSAFSTEDLEYFKENSGKIVITAVEFKKSSILNSKTHKEKFKKRFELADKIVFVGTEDKEACQKDAMFQESPLKAKVDNATVALIPSTVKISKENKPLQNRDKNILSFGVIRPFRNVEGKTLDIAEKLKQKGSDKKVLIVGSITSATTPDLLKQILQRVFGDQIASDLQKAGNDLTSLKKIATNYKGREIINAELHFDVEEKDLHNIFNRCSYSYNAYEEDLKGKGFSPHFSGVSNPLCLPNGMIFYGNVGNMTPNKADFEDKYPNMFRLNREKTGLDLTNWIVEDILEREPKLDFNALKTEHESFLKEHPLNIESVAKKYIDEVYPLERTLDRFDLAILNIIGALNEDKNRDTARQILSTHEKNPQDAYNQLEKLLLKHQNKPRDAYNQLQKLLPNHKLGKEISELYQFLSKQHNMRESIIEWSESLKNKSQTKDEANTNEGHSLNKTYNGLDSINLAILNVIGALNKDKNGETARQILSTHEKNPQEAIKQWLDLKTKEDNLGKTISEWSKFLHQESDLAEVIIEWSKFLENNKSQIDSDKNEAGTTMLNLNNITKLSKEDLSLLYVISMSDVGAEKAKEILSLHETDQSKAVEKWEDYCKGQKDIFTGIQNTNFSSGL